MKLMSAWIEKIETFSRVLHTDAVPFRLGTGRTATVVFHLHPESVSHSFDVGLYQTALPLWSDAMLNRILNNRLEKKARNKSVHRFRGDLYLHFKATGEPNLLDRKVTLDHS